MKFGYAADNMEIALTNVSFAYPTTGARTVGQTLATQDSKPPCKTMG